MNAKPNSPDQLETIRISLQAREILKVLEHERTTDLFIFSENENTEDSALPFTTNFTTLCTLFGQNQAKRSLNPAKLSRKAQCRNARMATEDDWDW